MTGRPESAASTPMLADIRRQPAVLGGLLARAGEFEAFARDQLRPAAGNALHAFGCGDGWFAARAAAAVAGRQGLACRPQGALPFLLETAPRLGPHDRVLAITMSGNVDRTLEAAEAARERGAPVALLTNGDGGRLGALGLPRLSLEIPELAPFLCGTATYTATLAALVLMLAGEAARAALARLAAALEAAIAEADATIGDLARPFAGVRLLAVGDDQATAEYGAAKLVEVTRTPAWSDDIEEFAHRQFWSADPGELVVYLASSPAVARYAAASAEALAAMGFTTLGVEVGDARVPTAAHRVRLPDAGREAGPLAMAVPLQLLAYRLALTTGLDPDTRAHLKADERRFCTSRLLTRRSLVGTGG